MRITLSIIFFLTSVLVYGQTIKGKVIDGTRDEIMIGAYLELYDSAYSKKLAETSADLDGRFLFSDLSNGVYSIRVHYIGYKDTTYSDINLNGNVDLVLDIHRFCEYDAARKNKVCPVCNKKDKVIPIEYGLLISDKGEGKTFKSGGCNITYCQPNWYCKRDKKEF